MLCKTYHTDKTSQDDLDHACNHFTEAGLLPIRPVDSSATVSKFDTVEAEVYVKFSLMSRARLEAELTEAGVIVSDKNISLATHGIPEARLARPGDATKQLYWIFPYVKNSDLPVLKLKTGSKLRNLSLVLRADANAYCEHSNDSFKHAAGEGVLAIDEDRLIGWESFRYSLDVSRAPVDGSKWEKGRAAKRSAATKTPSPSPRAKAVKAVDKSPRLPALAVPEPGSSLSSEQLAIVPADDDSVPGYKLPKAVQDQDEEGSTSDVETNSGLDCLRTNRMRCNLWHAAIHGADGNWRWQCQRAAAHQRELGNKDIANKLDEWLGYYNKVNMVSASKIMSSNESDIEAALDVLYEQYCETPAEIFPRLVAKKGAEVRTASKRGNYTDLIEVTFPWCLIVDDVPFCLAKPANAHTLNALDDKLTIFKTVIFQDCLKDMLLDKNADSKESFALCGAVHTKCQAIQNQRDYKPPPAELLAMSDVASSCRLVMCLIDPDLLSDSIYIDAIREAGEFAKAQAAGKTCLSMVTYWVNSSVELKKSFQEALTRLDALSETSKRIDSAKDELLDVTIDPDEDITLDRVAEYSKAICRALKAVAYSQGARVPMMSKTFGDTLPAHTATLFEACKTLLKTNNHSPSQVMEHIVKVVSEVSVVLPLNEKISGLETDLAMLQRSNDMNLRRHEWASATKSLTTEVSLDTLGQVDAAVKKFEGANFYDDDDLRRGTVGALQTFHIHCIDKYPLEPLRQDIIGFTQNLQQFIAQDPSKDPNCLAASSLAKFIVAGNHAYKLLSILQSFKLPEKAALLDPEHTAGQKAVLGVKHAMAQLSDLLKGTSDKCVTAAATESPLAAQIPKLFAHTRALLKDGEVVVQKNLKLMETVALETLEASSDKLEKVQYGLPDGQSYKDNMPAGKTTWSKLKSHIEATLGQSEVAANLDENIKESEKVCLIWGPFGPGPWEP